MDLGTDQQGLLRCKPHLIDEIGNGDEALVYDKIGVFGVSHEPLVGIAVGAEDKLQPFPFKAEADWSIKRMDRGKRTDRDPVVLIDDNGVTFHTMKSSARLSGPS